MVEKAWNDLDPDLRSDSVGFSIQNYEISKKKKVFTEIHSGFLQYQK